MLSKEAMMVKACVFDMGGVLLSFDFSPFYDKVLPHCGPGVCREDLVHLANQRHDTFGRGLISLETYFGQFREQLGVEMPLDAFAEAWNDIFTEMPETLALIRRLRQVRTLLLSNTDESHIAWVEQRFPDMLNLFEQTFYSHVLHERKPRPEAFRAVERTTGLMPEEHILIDDMQENIRAAEALGWRGVLFTTAASLGESLEMLGVRVAN
jgi:glucose-1-phosphatase